MRLEGISFLVPIYNHENYVRECIESIARLKYRPIELLMIDDCSSDRSYEMAQRALDEIIRPLNMRYLLLKNAKNLGPGASLNRLIPKTRLSHVMAIASDDTYLHENLDRILLRYHGMVLQWLVAQGLVSGTNNVVHPPEVYDWIKKGPQFLLKHLYTRVGFIFIQASIIDRHLLQRVGGWDEDRENSEDWSLTIKLTRELLRRNKKILVSSEPIFQYRQHAANSYKNARLQITRIVNCIDKYIPKEYGTSLKNALFVEYYANLQQHIIHLEHELQTMHNTLAFKIINSIRKLMSRLYAMLHTERSIE